jgi:hypothetical protein
MSNSINLGLPYLIAAQAQKHITHNEALRILDTLVHLAVLDRHLATPPGAPSEGQRWIVAASPTGAWAGHATHIAAWQDGAWQFSVPKVGWLAYVIDEGALLAWSGTVWADALTMLTSLQNMVLLGLGTTADGTNPFSAKLNNALWTAKTVAEGGDGHLRYKLSKESAAKTLSFLFQNNFSGRAEVGLIGDDNVAIKVSPDGSSWITAVIIDKGNGNVGLGIAPTDALHIYRAGAACFRLETDAACDFIVSRFSTNTSAPAFNGYKGRGTRASPSQVLAGDGLFELNGRGYDNSGTPTVRNAARVEAVAASDITSTSAEGRWRILACPSGSLTLTEIVRFEHATGFSMFGTNPVIDQNRHFRLRSYTIATLPAANAAAGQMIYCSDLGGGGGELNSDGTSWRRASRSGAQTVATDAAFTLTTLTSAEEQKHTGTLTANRTVTLSATNAHTGSRFRITRTGSGAFNLDIGGLKNLATNTWCEVIYDGAAWYLAAYGAL